MKEHFFDVEINNSIPISEVRNTTNSKGITDLFRKMKIGDSIVMPLKYRRAHSQFAIYAGIKTASRSISETEVRIWRIE
jgi:hypothetical protein